MDPRNEVATGPKTSDRMQAPAVLDALKQEREALEIRIASINRGIAFIQRNPEAEQFFLDVTRRCY